MYKDPISYGLGSAVGAGALFFGGIEAKGVEFASEGIEAGAESVAGVLDGGGSEGASAVSLPRNPNDLVEKFGYEETSDPRAVENGHRMFEHPETGDKLRFDAAKPGAEGHEGFDHYHRYNPDKTGRQDEYLDRENNSVSRGSNLSHLYPEDY